MDFKLLLEEHILDHPLTRFLFRGNVGLSLTKHLLMIWVASAALVALFLFLRFGSESSTRRLRLLIEAIVLFVRDEIVVPTMGEHGKEYLHYILTLFFFILACNLMGMFPFAATPTGNVSVTATLAICTFILIHAAGIRRQGFVHYLKSIVPSGIPGWLVPIMVPIELIGFITKTFALAVRLFMNMIAGHIVVLAFLALIFIFAALNPWVGLGMAPVSVVMSLFINLMELIIIIPLQTFIFTFLTAIFVGSAMNPEH